MRNSFTDIYERSSNCDEINQKQLDQLNLLVEQSDFTYKENSSRHSSSSQSKVLMKYLTPVKDIIKTQKNDKHNSKTKSKFFNILQIEEHQKMHNLNSQLSKLTKIIRLKNCKIAQLQQIIMHLRIQSKIKKEEVKKSFQNNTDFLNQDNLNHFCKHQQQNLENNFIHYKFSENRKQNLFLRKNNSELYQKLIEEQKKNKELQMVLQRSLNLNLALKAKLTKCQYQIQCLAKVNQNLISEKKEYLRNQQQEIQFIKKMKNHWKHSSSRSKQTENITRRMNSQNKQINSTMSRSINQSSLLSKQKSKNKIQKNQILSEKTKLNQDTYVNSFLKSKLKF